MRDRYDEQLKELHNNLLEMGSLCQEIIALAADSLQKNRPEKAEQVFAWDSRIDQVQHDVETMCLKLFLQQQPVATDLRKISAALKMVSDMERIGDQAADITELSPYLAGADVNGKVHIQEMAQATVQMVRDSVAAFVGENQTLAEAVIAADDQVDALFDQIRDELIELIRQNDIDAKVSLDLFLAAKYFERIGDHAVNVAEWVVYSITGEIQNNEHGAER